MMLVRATAFENHIEVVYKRGRHREYTSYLNTRPFGKWTTLEFDKEECDYVTFLDIMVYKNADVYRKMASFTLDELLDVPYSNRIQLLNAMKILDPTFTPPWINVNCNWQQDLVDTIVKKTFDIIDTCYNEKRLARYVSVLQSLRWQPEQ